MSVFVRAVAYYFVTRSFISYLFRKCIVLYFIHQHWGEMGGWRKMYSVVERDELYHNDLLNEKELERFFTILKANVVRARTPITAVFLTIYDRSVFRSEEEGQIETEISSFLQSQVRQTDMVSKLSEPYKWCILLSQSGEEEARAFVRRLYFAVEERAIPLFHRVEVSFTISVAEIGNSNVTFAQLLEHGKQALSNALAHQAWHIETIDMFKERSTEIVRVSILEDNGIFRNVLYAAFDNLVVTHFSLEVQTFSDGQEFTQSEWYKSSHTHLVIMNDILPRKNGIEVLHTLRKLPNNKKFLIIMMTKRKSEGEMIYAYENGVDEYVVKPFNLRLFEAKVKRILERLWL